MPVEVRQHTISVKLSGELDWTTEHFGETLPKLDPYGKVPIEIETVKADIESLRDFFIEHGSGKPRNGVAKSAPESGVSVHGIEEDGYHVVFVETNERSPDGAFNRGIHHRFYLYPNNVGIRRDVDFMMSTNNRVEEGPDVTMSEIVLAQKFVTNEEDLRHLQYVKAVLQRERAA